MSIHRTAARRDDAEPEVVDAFLDGGATVVKHSARDEADLIVGFLGVDHWIEVKSGNARLRPGQEQWAASWKGGPVEVVRNAAQANKCLRMWRAEFAERSKQEAKEVA